MMHNLLSFLRELYENNNKEWFESHKKHYLEVKSFTETLTQSLLNGISEFDPTACYLTPKDCTYRIYRDTRFSSDKTPYKTHIGIFINPPLGKKSLRMGYYLHLEPSNLSIGVGNIGLPTPILASIRESIRDNLEEFLSIIENPGFKKLFPRISENLIKTAPKGFSKDWKYIDLVRPRDFYVSHKLKEKEATAENFIAKSIKIFKIGKPFADFINYTVDDFIYPNQMI